MHIDIQEFLDNPTKKEIITRLMKAESLRYSELMPAEIDNVLFNYHLQHLVKLGILDKDDSNYSLSQKGKELTSNIAHNGLYFPKFVIRYAMYLVDRKENKVLFQQRKRSPWFGDTTAISSKVVRGSLTNERADYRMKEKTNLKTNMQCIGTYRKLVVNSQKDLLDDSVYFVCYADSFSGETRSLSDNQDPLLWLSFDEARAKEKTNAGSGKYDLEILDRFEKHDLTPFFFEEVITVESI